MLASGPSAPCLHGRGERRMMMAFLLFPLGIPKRRQALQHAHILDESSPSSCCRNQRQRFWTTRRRSAPRFSLALARRQLTVA